MDTISTLTFFQNAMAHSQKISSQLSTLQTQASTGEQFTHVSDNPTASLQILSNSDRIKLIDAHLNNIQSATTALNSGVSTLQQANSILSQAQSLALQARNSNNDSSLMSALGQQANGLISSMLALANTQNGTAYIFGGAGSSAQQPFIVSSQNAQGEPQAVTYQGAADGTSAIVDDNRQIQMYYPGNQAFQGQGTTGRDVFQTLIALRDTLNNAGGLSPSDQHAALADRITDLQNAQTQVQNVIGQQSASLQSMDTLQSQLQNLQTSMQEANGNLGNVDMAKVLVQLQSYVQQLQLSFEVFMQISSTSLLSYLR